MKMQFVRRFFSALWRSKALRVGYLTLGLLLVGSVGLAQTMNYNILTSGGPLLSSPTFINNQFCLNKTGTDQHTVQIAIERPNDPAFINWTINNANWSVPAQFSPPSTTLLPIEVNGIFYDRLNLILTFNPDIRDVEIGGTFTATWQGGQTTHIATTSFYMLPPTSMVDTIIIVPLPICQDSTIIFIARNYSDDKANLPYGELTYEWKVENINNPITSYVTSQSGTITESSITVSNYQPEYTKVTVQRAFCNIDNLNTLKRERNVDRGIEFNANPPLDTTNSNMYGRRQDQIHRMIWWNDDPGIPNTSKEAFGDWKMTSMNIPVCVNYLNMGGTYGRLQSVSNNLVNNGFAATVLEGDQGPEQAQVAQGFLFFQVGDAPDTSVSYVWIYDTALVERMYVGAGTSWGATDPGVSPRRWASPDPKIRPGGGGGFGDIVFGDTNTFRAIFRIKAHSPERRAELAARYQGDGIEIKVAAIGRNCSDPTTPSGFYQNDTISTGNIGVAWDTTKPMNNFTITKMTTNNFLAEDVWNSSCLETVAYFAINRSSTQTLWDLQSLKDSFNISRFDGGATSGISGYPRFSDSTSTQAGPPLVVRSFVQVSDPTYAIQEQTTTYYKYVVGANQCFHRNVSAISIQGQFASPNDTSWARIHAFDVQKKPLRPQIFDISGSLPRPITPCIPDPENPDEYICGTRLIDTLFICWNPLFDNTGQPMGNPGEYYGVRYLLANDNDSLSSSGSVFNQFGSTRSLISPIGFEFFHGWTTPVDNGSVFGRPRFMGARFHADMTNGPINVRRSEVEIYAQNHNADPEGFLMFAAQGICGISEPVIVPYVLRDTFSERLPVRYTLTPTIDASWQSWDVMADQTFCEGGDIYFQVPGDKYRPLNHTVVCEHPNSWRSYPGTHTPDGEFLQFRVTVGKDIGRVSFHTVNQCGGNTGVYSPEVKPIEYFRLPKNKWEQFWDTVCQDEIVSYVLPFSKDSIINGGGVLGDFYIRFPNDWRILGYNSFGSLPVGPNFDTISQGNLWFFGNASPHINSLNYRVETGVRSGFVEVRWKVLGCDLQPEYYGLPRIRPAWWDSIPVITHIYPKAPDTTGGGWADTVCARTELQLSVKAVGVDTLHEVNNFYAWTLPKEWELLSANEFRQMPDGSFLPIGKTVTVLTAPTKQDVSDTIIVRAYSLCDEEHEPVGTLRWPVWVWDTVPIHNNMIFDIFLDPIGQVQRKPCEDSILGLFVNNLPANDVESVTWYWSTSGNINNPIWTSYNPAWAYDPAADTLFNYWTVYDFELGMEVSDTLKFFLQGGQPHENYKPLHLQVGVNNRCGASRLSMVLEPGQVIPNTAIPVFSAFKDTFCFGEEFVFAIDTSGVNSIFQNADHLIWTLTQNNGANTLFETTIYDSYEFRLRVTDTGVLSVTPRNNCSPDTRSTDSTILEVRRSTFAPSLADFAGWGREVWSSGNLLYVLDTVCTWENFSWKVVPNLNDSELTDFEKFEWMILDDDVTLNTTFFTTSSIANDSVRVALGAKPRNMWVGVAGVRTGCVDMFGNDVVGDTLKIQLVSVDTVQAPSDWRIRISDGSICSGDTRRLCHIYPLNATDNDLPFGYRWYWSANSDPTWQFVGDNTQECVDVVVGQTPGTLNVVSTTGKYCLQPLQNRVPKVTVIDPEPLPELDGITVGYDDVVSDTVCSLAELKIAAVPNFESRVHGYRFTLYQQTIDPRNFNVSPNFSILSDVIQTENTFTFPIEDWAYNKIIVEVRAIDSTTCERPQFSAPLRDTVTIINSPRIALIGDMSPCIDSTIVYTVKRSDPYVTFELDYTNKSETIIVTPTPPDMPDIIVVDFLQSTEPDRDSVQFIFSNIRGYCSDEDYPREDQIYTIYADTFPTINFEVFENRSLTCMDDTLIITVEKYTDYNVYFNYKFSTAAADTIRGWRMIYHSEIYDTVVLLAPIYRSGDSWIDTIRVSAVGSCGTSEAKVLLVPVERRTTYNNILIQTDPIGHNGACENSALTAWITSMSAANPPMSSNTWIWWQCEDCPDQQLQTIDGTSIYDNRLKFIVPKGNPQDSITLSVRFYDTARTCGWSMPTILSVPIQNQPAMPELVQNPWPCMYVDPFGMSLKFDRWTDIFTWNTVGYAPAYNIETTEFASSLGRFINDSIYFPNIGVDPFRLTVTASNACGSRRDTFTITPADSIQPLLYTTLDDFIADMRFCFNNIVTGKLKVDPQYVNTLPTFVWTFPEDWIIVDNFIDKTDTTNVVSFIPGRDKGTISVWANSGTGCGVTNTIYSPEVESAIVLRNVFQSTDTTVYKDTTVFFYINSVESIGQAAPLDLSHAIDWIPIGQSWSENRFNLSENGDTAHLRIAYVPIETFVVQVTEVSDDLIGQACITRDTIYLVVEGSYSFDVIRRDSVCSNSEFEMAIEHKGGEVGKYRQEWYTFNPANGRHELIGTSPTVPDIIFRNQEIKYYFVTGFNNLQVNPEGTEFEWISITDTFWIKAIPPLTATLTNVDVIKIVNGWQEQIVRALNTEHDSVWLGEKLRFEAEVTDGGYRPSDYSYFIDWETEAFSPTIFPRSDNSLIAFSDLIFNSQIFKIVVYDPNADACETRDSVFIDIRVLAGSSKDFGPVPGAFTPVSGGVNKTFMVGVDEITILNRWGGIVYEAKRTPNRQGKTGQDGWDGRDQRTNRMVDGGDYFYIISICNDDNCNTKSTKTGVVSVF
ncbi:MAG: gliding motility-associated C-terminal domain-containing protein [Bacteroidales bacterium]|jgi:hypothetical protein|nr:gliding motility-associated C-terminal domain-containing protein [Bacteroidales bacterium]